MPMVMDAVIIAIRIYSNTILQTVTVIHSPISEMQSLKMEDKGQIQMAMVLEIIQTAMILMPSSQLQASGTIVMAMGMVITNLAIILMHFQMILTNGQIQMVMDMVTIMIYSQIMETNG